LVQKIPYTLYGRRNNTSKSSVYGILKLDRMSVCLFRIWISAF
jgi:hypothetical protein